MRPRKFPPYPGRPHKSGQARIKIEGRDVYLGKHGTPESRQAYARLIAALAGDDASPPLPERRRQLDSFTVGELVLAFDQWAAQRYVKDGRPTSELSLLKTALKPVVRLYGLDQVADFGPRALITCRDQLVSAGFRRSKINAYVRRIRQVFRWGVERELVPVAVWQALTAVAGLRHGELGAAREGEPVKPVGLDRVLAIRRHVSPPVWAMILLQLRTGARPGEICVMRPRDIDTSGEVWVYRPGSHKLQHHERGREVYIARKAQRLLLRWMEGKGPEDFLFSPEAARTWRANRDRARRKTPLYGRERDGRRPRKSKPRRNPRLRYDVASYRRAITRACEIAFKMPADLRKIPGSLPLEERSRLRAIAAEWRQVHAWHPHQLRHTFATRIRRVDGVETTRVLLGHANLSTTEIYAEADRARAIRAISSIG